MFTIPTTLLAGGSAPALVGELWEIPETPHELDDEFEGSVIDPAWDSGVTLDYVTPMDPYNPATGHRGNINDTNPSWLMVQGTAVYSKAFPGGLPTNCLIWARMRWSRDLADINGRTNHAIWFGASSGGLYDNSNQLAVSITEWLAGEYAQGYYRNGGSFPRWGSGTAHMNNEGTSAEYVAIQKLGSVYHGWIIGHGGNRFYLGSVNESVLPGTLDRIGFTISGSQVNPGVLISGIDFFRVIESAVFVP
jgi:hypothetical protein